MAGLVVTVGGNIAEVSKTLDELKQELQDLNNAVKTTKDVVEISKLNDAIKRTQAEIKRIKDIGPILPPDVTKSANSAAISLQNVGRVAQDLPYGFIGIQNNLNPLLESFERLKAETGSGKAALKALAGSLIGAGGIGLALSVVSSAILIFQNGIAGFNKKTSEAKEKTDELAKAIKDISSITGEATAGVQGQIAQVSSLAAAVSNSNLSYAERNRALQELREVNKSYFGDLRLEDALTGKLASTVNEYTDALINSAIQKQFIDEIASVAKAAATADEQIVKSRDRVTRANAAVIKAQEAASARQLEINKRGAVAQSITTDPEVVRALKEQSNAYAELATNNEASTKLQEQEILLTNKLNAAVLQGLKYRDLQTNTIKKQRKATDDLLKSQLKVDSKIHFQFPIRTEIPKQITDVISKATANEKITITLHDVRVKLLGSKTTAQIEGKENIEKELGQQLNSVFENIKLDSLTTLGETIGNIFSGEGFGEGIKNGIKSMLSILGTAMQQLGKYVINAALEILALKKIVESFVIKNPALAILGGVALIAAGAALKNISVDVPALADGGVTTGPTLALIGEKGTEVVLPLSRLQDMFNNNSNSSNLNVSVGLGIRGRELVPFIERETKAYKRIN